MDKYSEIQEREKLTARELELFEGKLRETENKLQESLEEVKKLKEESELKEALQIYNIEFLFIFYFFSNNLLFFLSSFLIFKETGI